MLEMLDTYNEWKARNGEEEKEEVKTRREKLLATGLVKEIAPAIKDGYKPKVLAILKKEKKPLTAQQLTDKVRELLQDGETTDLKKVRFYLDCHAEKDGIKQDGDKYKLA